MRILGCDPGVTTGFVVIGVTDDTEPVLEDFFLVSGGYKGIIKSQHLLNTFEDLDLVVQESFILRRGGPMTSEQIAPTYGIGALEMLASLEMVPTVLRSPAENKSAVSNEALKRLDLWGQGDNTFRHARDAARVVAGYLKASLHKPTLRKGWES